jgi:hypothetical protein
MPGYFPSLTKRSIVIFFLTVAVSAFWLTGFLFNVYKNPVVGAIFEILWFPSIALSISLPAISIIAWVKEKFQFKSLYLCSILLSLTTLLIAGLY